MTDNYIGIDYGGGTTNTDKATGIRYGVISQHSINLDYLSDFDQDYGKPTCPECGGDVIDSADAPDEEWNEGLDYACESCEQVFESGDCYGDEPIGQSYEVDGYQIVDCLDTDLMILKSPYFTLAQFCSPCVPGAGNLDNPVSGGIPTYCLGHDWFEDNKAPYPVYEAATGALVEEAHE